MSHFTSAHKSVNLEDIIARGGRMDRLDAITAFAAIVDHGTFAAAARALRSSPPAMTRAVAALEERLGVRLLHRSTRSVRLTEEGAVYLERCRRILADLRDAEMSAMGAAAEPQGTLVATASQLFGRLHVVPIVASLLAAHPRLRVRLLLVDRPIQLVEEGVDVALRIGALADSALRAIKVGEVRHVMVAAPGYLDRHGTPTAPSDLSSHAIIAFSGISPTDEWRFGTAERSVVHVQPRLVVNTADAALAAAEGGDGIVRVLSYQASEGLAAGRLVRVLGHAEPDPVPVSLQFDAGRASSPNVRAFVNAARVHFIRGL